LIAGNWVIRSCPEIIVRLRAEYRLVFKSDESLLEKVFVF
jgi:hypothetical protein